MQFFWGDMSFPPHWSQRSDQKIIIFISIGEEMIRHENTVTNYYFYNIYYMYIITARTGRRIFANATIN